MNTVSGNSEKPNKKSRKKALLILIPLLAILAFGVAMTSLNFRMDVCVYTNHKLCINIPIRPAPTWISHPSNNHTDGDIPQKIKER